MSILRPRALRMRQRHSAAPICTIADYLRSGQPHELAALCHAFGLPEITLFEWGLSLSFDELDRVMRERPKPGRAGE